MNRTLPILLVLAASCTASDADLDGPALLGIDLDATVDQVDQRQTAISGTVELGYTADGSVELTVLDNGTPVWSELLEVRGRELTYAATLDLLDPDVNALVATAEWRGESISAAASVAVPGALQAFTLTPDTVAAAAMEVPVQLDATLGFTGGDPAQLTVAVDGQTAVSRSVTPDQLALALSEVVPLPSEGSHTVEAWLAYEGVVLADSATVSASAPAPTVTLPTWSTVFDPGVAMTATGQLEIAAPAPWEVAAVRQSVDEGLTWTAASDAGGGLWDLTVVDPEILGQPVRYEVDLVHRGVVSTTTWEDTLVVDPVFDCNSQLSMQPTTELIEDHNREVRTMVGYFGDPDGDHDVAFVIDVSVPNDGLYQVVGQTLSRGRFSLETEYNTDRLNCGGDCTIDYDLTVLVDGQVWCSETNFGVIREY